MEPLLFLGRMREGIDCQKRDGLSDMEWGDNYVHQTYLTPRKITAIYGGETGKCPRCAAANADFEHMVCACPHAQEYWKAVVET